MKKKSTCITFFVLSLILMTGVKLMAQRSDFEELKLHYQNEISMVDSCEAPGFAKSNDPVMQIVLIRHGKPKLNKKGWFSAKDARNYSEQYDEVEVYDFDSKPFCFDEKIIDTIYSSNLTRAASTAKKIIGDQPIVLIESSLFREFEREVFQIPVLRMPLNFWLVSSRLLWYSGLHSRNTESYNAAKHRVNQAAAFLEGKSKEKGQTALVAHGMFNNRLSKILQKNGWTLLYENGNGYLSIRVLAKRK